MEKGLELIKDDLQRDEKEFKSRLVSRVPLISKVAEHLVMGGGKRFRITLLLPCARLCGYKSDDHIPLAGVIEFIHTATLLHDAVIDNAEVRRGSASANNLWGNEASVLVGDFLLSKSFAMMVDVGDLRILHTLASAILLRSSASSALAASYSNPRRISLWLTSNAKAFSVSTSP